MPTALLSCGVTTNGTEPQNPLVPSNTTEVGGGKIVTLIFAGPTSFNAKGDVQMDQAESVEPNDDNTEWTIKLKKGLKFSDGTPVKADNFIKAWNYAANSKNAQGSQYFFENIEGYSEDKPVSELKGLKKVSDTEFTVKLNSPESSFPKRIGYSAFVPLPDSAFKDMKKFGEKPVGNGPYKLDSWTHNEGAKLVTNKDYQGPRTAKNGGVDISFYSSLDSAYQDAQSGQLDVLDQVPPSAYTTFEDDFADRNVNQPAAIFQSFTIPQYLDHFKNNEEGKLRRKAISMAIDRDAITKAVFNDTRTPAKDFTSPVIEGWSDKVPGNEVLNYNVDEAKKLWAQADKISKYDDTFTIAYNSDGGHEPWVTAVTNNLAKNLGIKAQGKPYAAFKQLLDDEDARKMKGAFRSGWQADYPAMDNFLAPLYQTGAGSNYGDYSNKKFDQLLKDGAKASTPEEATKKYEESQSVLFQDLPAIPLWYQNVSGVYGENVQNVQFGWDSVPLYYDVTKEASK